MQWTGVLKEYEYDFEQRNSDGNTPLLFSLRGYGAQTFCFSTILLELGANIHTIKTEGESALQCAMTSSRQEHHRGVLEQKLYLLIEAGIDTDGYLTIAAASHYDCLDEWCRTLERSGLSNNDISHTGLCDLGEEFSPEQADGS